MADLANALNAAVPTRPKTGKEPGLVQPDGVVFRSFSSSLDKPRPLLPADLPALLSAFEAREAGIVGLIETVKKGALLDAVLSLANNNSFLDDALKTLGDRASFENLMRRLIDGEHTSWYSYSADLPFVTIFYDSFLSIPIEENLQAIAEGNQTLRTLAGLVGDKELFETGRRGLTQPQIAHGKVLAHGVEISVESELRPVPARNISAESSVIEHNGTRYYNGLPGDRGRFPTFVMDEGERITMKVRNTSPSSLVVLPTINGMPFHIEQLSLDGTGFDRSSLPVVNIRPHMFRLKPGEECTLSHFQVDRIQMEKDGPRYSASSFGAHEDAGSLVQLAPLVRGLCSQQLSAEDRKILDSDIPVAYREQLLLAMQVQFLRDFLKDLLTARKTPIVARRPVVADGIASSELSNPMLGSLGLAVVRLEPVPVKAHHDPFGSGFGGEFYTMRGGGGGATRGMGAAGLASIGGGSDLGATAARSNILDATNAINRFLGYVPMNLMSARAAS